MEESAISAIDKLMPQTVSMFKGTMKIHEITWTPFVNKKQNSESESFLISSVVWPETREESPGYIFYKTSFEGNNFKVVSFK